MLQQDQPNCYGNPTRSMSGDTGAIQAMSMLTPNSYSYSYSRCATFNEQDTVTILHSWEDVPANHPFKGYAKRMVQLLLVCMYAKLNDVELIVRYCALRYLHYNFKDTTSVFSGDSQLTFCGGITLKKHIPLKTSWQICNQGLDGLIALKYWL